MRGLPVQVKARPASLTIRRFLRTYRRANSRAFAGPVACRRKQRTPRGRFAAARRAQLPPAGGDPPYEVIRRIIDRLTSLYPARRRGAQVCRPRRRRARACPQCGQFPQAVTDVRVVNALTGVCHDYCPHCLTAKRAETSCPPRAPSGRKRAARRRTG